MNIQETNEVIEYVMKNHSWKASCDWSSGKPGHVPPLIKYVTFHLDTRDGEVYAVSFRNVSGGGGGEKIFGAGIDASQLKYEILKWLQSFRPDITVIEGNLFYNSVSNKVTVHIGVKVGDILVLTKDEIGIINKLLIDVKAGDKVRVPLEDGRVLDATIFLM